MLPKDIAKAISEVIDRKLRNSGPKVYLAEWVGAEAVDANLSEIVINDTTFHNIPKLSGLSLTAEDPILVIKGDGLPIIIVGKIIGDTNIDMTVF